MPYHNSKALSFFVPGHQVNKPLPELTKVQRFSVLYEKDYRLCKATIFNSLPNDKIWDVTELKAFADNK